MGRKKLNLVRFSVHMIPEVKIALEALAAQNGRSLAIEARRILAEFVQMLPPPAGAPASVTDRPTR